MAEYLLHDQGTSEVKVFTMSVDTHVVQPRLEPKWQSVHLSHIGDVYGLVCDADVNSCLRMIVCTHGLPTRQTKTFG